MTENIIKKLQTVDIAGIVFDEVLSSLPDDSEEYQELMKQIRPLLPADLFLNLESAVNSHVAAAMETAFRAGWVMRGRA